MDTIIGINIDYCIDEIEVIVNDYTSNIIWSNESRDKIFLQIKNYFLNNKKYIVEEVDKLVCNEIKKILEQENYIINGGKYE